ncbi:unnamed protein product [Orchesella dallaii]|uniref:Uncharacterized protein n=1 Tax=Orchesella dallaii TaxID=48710 RepID=A0ABP1QZC3_9HEXA
MEQLRLIFYFMLVATTLVSFSSTQIFLDNERFYYIKNALDSSYLRVEKSGSPCQGIGSVGTSSFLNTSSIAYRWKYIVFMEEVTFLDIEWTEMQLHLNQLSRYASAGRGSHCLPLYRRLNVTEVSGNLYRLQDVESELCLASQGNGSQVLWDICNQFWSQQWEFIMV